MPTPGSSVGQKRAPVDQFESFFNTYVNESIAEYKQKNELLKNAYETLNKSYGDVEQQKDELDGKYRRIEMSYEKLKLQS